MDVSSFLGGRFLTHLDLPADYQVWTIASADQQSVGNDQKICLTITEFPSKPLGLNQTNIRRIVELYSKNAGNWIGKQLLVFRSVTQFQGQSKLCVRVCGPQQAPPDPVCDQQGNAVFFQPPPASPQPQAAPVAPPQLAAPVAAPQPTQVPAAPQQPTADPWQADHGNAQQNTPPQG